MAGFGLSVKIIPLVVVIIAGLVFIPIGYSHPIDSTPIEGIETPYNSSFLNILTVMPAILFTYNGFLTSGGIMNEAKSYKTYKIAFLSAMFFAGAIYI
jgi:amino acid transporter